MLRSFIAVTIVAAFVPSASAALVSFASDDVGAQARFRWVSSWGSGWTAPIDASAWLEATIDDEAISMSFDAVTIRVPETTIALSRDFTVGIGQSQTLTFDLTFESFTTRLTPTESLSLTPTTGGDYVITDAGSACCLSQLLEEPVLLEGSYWIRGGPYPVYREIEFPMETILSEDSDEVILRAEGFPDFIEIEGSRSNPFSLHVFQSDAQEDPLLAWHVIDGNTVSFRLIDFELHIAEPTILNARIPEPSPVGALMAAAALAALGRRRRCSVLA